MAFKFNERPESRKTTENPRTITLEFVAEGTQDVDYVRTQAMLRTAIFYGNLWRQDIQVNPQGFNLWYVTVPYGVREPSNAGGYEYTFNFDTTGGTAKITHAKAHIQSYNSSGTFTPASVGAIGVNQNGDVEGCEVVVPNPKWTETFKNLPKSNFPFNYLDVLEALTGTVNNATFRGRTAGTVRFDGAAGGASNTNPDVCEFTFHFTSGRNVTGLSFGSAPNAIASVAKGACQYLWIEYEQDADIGQNKNVAQPKAVHIEQVYDAANFALLTIGT